MRARLLTIGISHYCEKARWALDRARVAYVEEAHAPMFHMLAGRGTRPRLLDGAVDLRESSAIVRFADAALAAEDKLVPAGAIGEAATAFETRFDDTLGVDVRRIAYALIGGEPALFGRVGAPFAPPLEARAIRATPRLFLTPILKAYRATAGSPPPRAVDRVRATFDEVSTLVRRQPYLTGDRLTIADVAFASLAAPVVLPSKHPAMPAHADVADTALGAFAAELRATPAGEFLERLYRDHR